VHGLPPEPLPETDDDPPFDTLALGIRQEQRWEGLVEGSGSKFESVSTAGDVVRARAVVD